MFYIMLDWVCLDVFLLLPGLYSCPCLYNLCDHSQSRQKKRQDKKNSNRSFYLSIQVVYSDLITMHHDLFLVSNCEVQSYVPQHAVFYSIFAPEDNKYNSQ